MKTVITQCYTVRDDTKLRLKVNSTIAYKLGLTKFPRILRPAMRDFFVKIGKCKEKEKRTHIFRIKIVEL